MSSLKYAGNGGGGIAPGPTSKKKLNKYYIQIHIWFFNYLKLESH